MIHTCATDVQLNYERYYDISCGSVGVWATSVKIKAAVGYEAGLNGIAILGYEIDCSDPANISLSPDEWVPSRYHWCLENQIEVSVSSNQIGCTYEI